MDTNLNNDMEKEKDRSEIHVEYKDDIEVEGQSDAKLEKENTIEKSSKKKIKKKQRIFSSSIFLILTVLIFTLISVGSYVPIRENMFSTKDSVRAYIQGDDFVHKIDRTRDDFIETLGELTRYLKESDRGSRNWYAERFENLESIKYYMNSRDKDFSISNIPDVTESVLQNQINNSQFYVHVKTDANAKAMIKSSLDNRFNNELLDELDLKDEYIEEETNLDIVYIIPNNLDNYNDYFTYKVKYSHTIGDVILILGIGLVSVIILSIVAFAIPYSLQSRALICRIFNKMFLELKLLLIGLAVSSCVGGIYLVDDSYGYTNDFGEFFNILDVIYNANEYFYLIGIPITFGLFLLIYLSIVYIKHIYHTGFKKGFILNSLLGRMCFFILTGIKRVFRTIIEIDIRKSIYRKLILILAINLIILCTIAIFGEIGVIIAIVYTIVLFKYLSSFFMKIKTINDASSKLEQGNFDIGIDEKMGVFSPIAKNLNNIKDGLKVAIDKEIRSQKMKTELISNVSHDLKTPLTSIITYVDLLKSQDITEETQKEYIEILDKKSKRLKVLIEDLFEASKASSGNIDLVLEKVDIIALFRQTLGELEEKINHSTLQIKMNVPEEKLICELDGRRTYRIFENIMSNILKYSMPNSRVYIDVVGSEREVSFIFKNISAYEMNFDAAEITERFTRGDKSRNTEGSGLGLAIAKNLVELQNGELSIKIDGDLFKLITTFPIEN